MPRNPKFNAFAEHALELHDKKNHDYASDNNPYSNFEFAAHYAGITVDQVFDVMIGVKQARLIELTSAGKTPNNESIWDTKRDLAVYAMLKASYSMKVVEKEIPSICTYFYGKAMYPFECVRCDRHFDTHPKTHCDKFTPANDPNLCYYCGYSNALHPRVEPPA